MKRVIGLVVAFLICFSLACPVFAAEFVPSITYKPEPEMETFVDEDGNEFLGSIFNAEGELLDRIQVICLKATPISHVWNEDIEVAKEIERVLKKTYEGLSNGTRVIPYAELREELSQKHMVIRDLCDVRWDCEEHPKMVAPDGVMFEVNFNLGVAPDLEVYAFSYNEETDEWEAIVDTINNGDGTITCIFEHLCVVAFSVPVEDGAVEVMATENVEAPNVMPWIVILVVAAAALVGILVAKHKKRA